VDEVPAKWSMLLLKGLETQENVFAANTNMTNVICIPMSLPEVWAAGGHTRPRRAYPRVVVRRLFIFLSARPNCPADPVRN